VPVAGILLGAGLNLALPDSIIGAACWAYREQFIREKSGDFEVQLPAGAQIGTRAAEGATEQPIDVFGIVHAWLAEESSQEADAEQGTTGPNRMLPGNPSVTAARKMHLRSPRSRRGSAVGAHVYVHRSGMLSEAEAEPGRRPRRRPSGVRAR
jgi:hypothetical protein